MIAIRENELKFNDPARRILGWLDRISGLLVGSIKILAQNRARGRRLVEKNIKFNLDLIAEVCFFLVYSQTLALN